MSELNAPYVPRPVTGLGIWRCRDWRLKQYTIAYRREAARLELIEAAKRAAGAVLPAPAVTPTRYGVGFLGVHDGSGSNFVFVDWWEHENELHHHVFFSTTDDPGRLRAATPDDPISCIWDLTVIAHERQAWIRHALSAHGADLDAYLEDQFSALI